MLLVYPNSVVFSANRYAYLLPLTAEVDFKVANFRRLVQFRIYCESIEYTVYRIGAVTFI